MKFNSNTYFFAGLACRILQVGPRGSKFLGSVMIEVPHVASLRDGDREVIILRCDTAAKNKWSEHKQEEEIDEKILRVRTITVTISVARFEGITPFWGNFA